MLPSLVKYLYDTYAIKFIVTGSSSYYIKNLFSESLAGRKRIFEMFPLSFKEFLQVLKNSTGMLKQSEKYAWQPFQLAWYNQCKDLYAEYLNFGGFLKLYLPAKQLIKRNI
ncbi:MAG: AAA family ATPase [Cytophagales bacterium]|nr:AAA family ATPase [Cytophagales bacterium]